jgi:hypothetical protein
LHCQKNEPKIQDKDLLDNKMTQQIIFILFLELDPHRHYTDDYFYVKKSISNLTPKDVRNLNYARAVSTRKRKKNTIFRQKRGLDLI